MKLHTTLALAMGISLSGFAIAQHAGMADMDMPTQKITNKKITHQTSAIVKSVDAKKRTVMLAHEPIDSLQWPAMTMGFKVKNKALLSKLTAGKNVKVEFVQQGKDYVITAVR